MREWTTGNGSRVTEVLHGRCNCFLVRTGNARMLIDTGRTRSWKRLRAALAVLGIAPCDPLDVLLTHTHFDHAENVAALRDTYATTVLVHRIEAPMLAAGRGPIPAGTVAPTRFLMRLAGDRATGWFGYRPAPPDIAVEDGTDLADRGLAVRVVHTPGHTAGSIAAIVDGEIALVGDALVGVMPGAIFPPFGEDARRIVDSWGVLLETGCRIFLPAHGFARDRATVERQFARFRPLP